MYSHEVNCRNEIKHSIKTDKYDFARMFIVIGSAFRICYTYFHFKFILFWHTEWTGATQILDENACVRVWIFGACELCTIALHRIYYRPHRKKDMLRVWCPKTQFQAK